MALFVVLLALVLVPMAAFVIDIADAFALRRHLQASADAAALAAAAQATQDEAREVACEYSAEQLDPEPVGVVECEPLNVLPGRNARADGPGVDTQVEFLPQGVVKVTQSARSNVFFGGIFDFDGIDVSADAEAEQGPPVALVE